MYCDHLHFIVAIIARDVLSLLFFVLFQGVLFYWQDSDLSVALAARPGGDDCPDQRDQSYACPVPIRHLMTHPAQYHLYSQAHDHTYKEVHEDQPYHEKDHPCPY